MIKIIFVLLIITTSTLIGIYKYVDIKDREKMLINFKEMIMSLETEIEYFKEPLPNIFEKICKKSSNETKAFIECIINNYDMNNSIATLWPEAVTIVYEKSPLNADDIDILKRVGEFLGQSDYSGQKKQFFFLHKQLDQQIHDAELAVKTKGKMYAKLGLSLGIVLGILFI